MKAVKRKAHDGSEQVLFGAVIMKEKPARKRMHRQEWSFSRNLLRIREIEKIIRHRHGSFIPDPTGTDDVDLCLAYAKAVALTPSSQDVGSWCAKWAPWIDPVTLQIVSALGAGRKWMIKADAVAKLLSVTMDERQHLGLRTVGACNMPVSERKVVAKENKRERDRRRQAQKREQFGRLDRESYEATSLSRLKPWEAEGISRKTWYRRRDTGVSRIGIKGNGDTLVSKADCAATGTSSDVRQDREAGLMPGLGDDPPAELQEAAPHGNGDSTQEQAA